MSVKRKPKVTTQLVTNPKIKNRGLELDMEKLKKSKSLSKDKKHVTERKNYE